MTFATLNTEQLYELEQYEKQLVKTNDLLSQPEPQPTSQPVKRFGLRERYAALSGKRKLVDSSSPDSKRHKVGPGSSASQPSTNATEAGASCRAACLHVVKSGGPSSGTSRPRVPGTIDFSLHFPVGRSQGAASIFPQRSLLAGLPGLCPIKEETGTIEQQQQDLQQNEQATEQHAAGPEVQDHAQEHLPATQGRLLTGAGELWDTPPKPKIKRPKAEDRTSGAALSGRGRGSGRSRASSYNRKLAQDVQAGDAASGSSMLDPLPWRRSASRAPARAADGVYIADDAGGVGLAGSGVQSASDGGQPLLLTSWDGRTTGQVPASINQHLRDYQREGVQFLWQQYALGKGGILADDMGLGKTVQTIAFVAAVLGKRGDASDRLQQNPPRHQGRVPILILCPTSVLDNWEREFERWTGGGVRVAKCHGGRAVDKLIEDVQQGKVEVILTTYDMLRLHAKLRDEERHIRYHCVIADEAHKLKNALAVTYGLCDALSTQLRFGLSGTIMQNTHKELWCLLNWAYRNCLGDWKTWKQYHIKPIMTGQRQKATAKQLADGVKHQTEVVAAVRRVVLRRTKTIIADQMPRKIDNVVFCELKPVQVRAYHRFLTLPDVQLLARADEPCDCSSGEKRSKCCHRMAPPELGGVIWPQYHCCDCDNVYHEFYNPTGCKYHRPEGCSGNDGSTCPWCIMLPILSIARAISNHLDLLKPATGPDVNERHAMRQQLVAEAVLQEDVGIIAGATAGGLGGGGFLATSNPENCGKMAALQELLRLWRAKGDKVLVFSHSVRMLNIIEAFVVGQGYDYVRLDGSTPMGARQGLVDEFNHRQSLFLFLISTPAGGLGLNLTSANKVVIFDPSWNPALDLQAQDRAFRIGQKRDVSVYRLIACGTLEELIYDRQIYKQQQSNMVVAGTREKRYFDGVQGDRNNKGELFGICNMLLYTGDNVKTRKIINDYEEVVGAGGAAAGRQPRTSQQAQHDAQGEVREVKQVKRVPFEIRQIVVKDEEHDGGDDDADGLAGLGRPQLLQHAASQAAELEDQGVVHLAQQLLAQVQPPQQPVAAAVAAPGVAAEDEDATAAAVSSDEEDAGAACDSDSSDSSDDDVDVEELAAAAADVAAEQAEDTAVTLTESQQEQAVLVGRLKRLGTVMHVHRHEKVVGHSSHEERLGQEALEEEEKHALHSMAGRQVEAIRLAAALRGNQAADGAAPETAAGSKRPAARSTSGFAGGGHSKRRADKGAKPKHKLTAEATFRELEALELARVKRQPVAPDATAAATAGSPAGGFLPCPFDVQAAQDPDKAGELCDVFPAVVSLAMWKGVSAGQMAKTLLGMTEEGRTQLRIEYAEAHP